MAKHEMTHADGVSGAGGLTGETPVTVGTVTLPAGGPWNIWGIYYALVEDVAVTTEESIHILRVLAPNSSDFLDDAPAPFDIPALSIGPIAGDGAIPAAIPHRIIPTAWRVAGRGQVRFQTFPDQTISNAIRASAGVLFGTKPNLTPLGDPLYRFCDRVSGTSDGTAEASIGTITLSERAKMITGLAVTVDHQTNVEGEEINGLFRIQSDDLDLAPARYPFSHYTSAGLDPAEAIFLAQAYVPKFVPVSIPVPGGARIEFLTDLDQDVTNALRTNCYVRYI
jgi:hypothetical protein